MGAWNIFTRIRAWSARVDDQRHDLERRIALYNTASYTSKAERAELDRVLDDILGQETGSDRPGSELS
jgi:hypothetical protein